MLASDKAVCLHLRPNLNHNPCSAAHAFVGNPQIVLSVYGGCTGNVFTGGRFLSLRQPPSPRPQERCLFVVDRWYAALARRLCPSPQRRSTAGRETLRSRPVAKALCWRRRYDFNAIDFGKLGPIRPGRAQYAEAFLTVLWLPMSEKYVK